MAEYQTKLSILRAHMKAGRWPVALKMAAKFQELGDHKAAITRGADALTHPGFYRQLGKDPSRLEAEGIVALKARYIEQPFAEARRGLPACVQGFDPLGHTTVSDLVFMVQHELDMLQEGEETDIRSAADTKVCQRFLARWQAFAD